MAPPSMLEQALHRNRVIVMVALLSVIGHNFRRILAWLSNLLRLILIALWRAFATSVAHNPAF